MSSLHSPIVQLSIRARFILWLTAQKKKKNRNISQAKEKGMHHLLCPSFKSSRRRKAIIVSHMKNSCAVFTADKWRNGAGKLGDLH